LQEVRQERKAEEKKKAGEGKEEVQQ